MPPAFFRQLADHAGAALRPRLRADVASAWEQRARAARPALTISASRLAAHLGRHLTAEVLDAPQAWITEDLLLALACLDRQAPALAELDRWLRGADDEVGQRVRDRLLVGPPPRLEQYAGRSPLKAWVALVAKRIAIDVRREAAPAPAPTTLAGLIRATPELGLIQRDAARHVSAALKAALRSLDERDRDLLRGHYLEGKSHAQLGEEMGAPRTSVANWLEKARGRLLTQTRALLAERTGLDTGELDSLLGAVGSNLDLSFSSLREKGDRRL